jgi:hypothetical protein
MLFLNNAGGTMKNVIILFLLVSPSFASSMELVPLLEKNISQNHEIVRENKRTLVRHLYPRLFLLQQTISIPHEIWGEIYTKMVEVMFEGDKKFEECFYNKPVAEALQLYHMIKKNVGDKPIAPLYKMNQETRDIIFSQLHPWYADYVNPVMSIQEQQIIYALDANVRQYFLGKDVRVISVDETTSYGFTFVVCGVANATAYGIGTLMQLLSCCIGGTKLACSPFILGLSLGMPAGFTLVTSLGLCWYVVPVHYDQSNKVML